MDKLTGMRVLVEVAKSGSFSTAARHVGISAAMVTKHIKRLEDDLGVRLLNRSTRRSRLTEAGNTYYQRCVDILQAIDDAETDAISLSDEVRGELKITAPSTIGARYLTPAIMDFKQLYPGLSINLYLGRGMPNLLEGGFDLAIHAGATQLGDSSIVARRLGSFEMVLASSPGYLQAHDSPHHPTDLLSHNCLIFQTDMPHDSWAFQGKEGEVLVQVTGNFYCNQGNALRVAALRDEGIVRLPDYLIGEDVRSGNLVRLMPEYQTRPRAVYALYPHRQHLPAKVRMFVDFLVERFESHRSEVKELPQRHVATQTH